MLQELEFFGGYGSDGEPAVQVDPALTEWRPEPPGPLAASGSGEGEVGCPARDTVG